MITEKEQIKLGNKILEMVEQLNKMRWDLITISLKLIPAVEENKK